MTRGTARRSRLPSGALCLAAVAAVLVAGCGDNGDEDAKKTVGEVASVACPSQARAVRLPAGWAVPLPSGAVPVDVRHSSNNRVIVTSVVPSAEKDVLTAMQRNFSSAGLTLTDGETEQHDAESNFTGNGITGRWGIRELTGCDGPATRIDVVVRKT
jgi:hypothetical protein